MPEQPGLLSISGVDAKRFLQGQLTCNLEEVTTEVNRLGAHCNPQGRIISFFRIFLLNNEYFLQMPRRLISIAQAALNKYAVFFKVTLNDVSDSVQTITPIDEASWQVTNIAAGIPAIYPETSEKFLPHELNLQKLDAISFNKGCYTGQEIIARMHYRGKLKNHMYRAQTQSLNTPIRGAEIFSDTNSAGYIVDFVQLNNHYELLIIAPENAINLYLDAERKFNLNILASPYSL